MNMYEEIENNILRINISNHNHHYKYYMRVMEHGISPDTAEYHNLEVENFCEYYNIVVLDANDRPMYNNSINFSLNEFCHYLKACENNKDNLIQFVLSEKTNLKYLKTTMYSSTQREFVTCYYPEGIDEEVLETVEAYIGDKVFICQWDNVSDGSYYYIAVPNLLDNYFLKFAMSATGCKEDEIYIECFEKYTVRPQYRHLEFK